MNDLGDGNYLEPAKHAKSARPAGVPAPEPPAAGSWAGRRLLRRLRAKALAASARKVLG